MIKRTKSYIYGTLKGSRLFEIKFCKQMYIKMYENCTTSFFTLGDYIKNLIGRFLRFSKPGKLPSFLIFFYALSYLHTHPQTL